MRTRAFLDSNVFIFGFERPKSNCHRILELLVAGEIQGVVTDRVVHEVMGYFRKHHGKDLAAEFRDLMLLTSDLVLEQDLRVERSIVARVGRKDAGAVAATRKLGLARLVSTDRDFNRIPEHRTPRAFLAEIGKRPLPGEE